jgi:3-methyl-2-oxobutanoate hydroxymethyltransferase
MATDDRPFTLNDLRKARTSGERFAMLTCYDYTTARHLDDAGVPILLVGDSAANVILGYDSTLPVSLDLLIELTAAVKRGAKRAMVMGDMPFGSYHESTAQGVRNVVRMIKESHCDCVKIEASDSNVGMISRLADAGVAIVAHIGLRPQAVGLMGGYKFQGRTAEEGWDIVQTANDLYHAGAAAILLEAVPDVVSARVVQQIDIPVIGCGAGPSCHAHVVVLQDLLGLTPFMPKFVPDIPPTSIAETARRFITLIREGAYPSESHQYMMSAEERERFEAGETEWINF